MDMANQGFLGKREGSGKPIDDDLLADAKSRQEWRASATRSLMEDLNVGFQAGAAVATRPAEGVPAEEAARRALATCADSEMFLAGPGRKKAGERRRQILSGFVEMLESRKEQRITTSALARHLELSEAALYRRFESKSEMLESLIALIEVAIFTQVGQVHDRLTPHAVGPRAHTVTLVSMLLKFAEHHPGISRVMAGDALVLEDEFLRLRMTQFFTRFEDTLAQVLRGEDRPLVQADDGPAVLASALSAFCVGRLLRFSRSGFSRLPSSELDACLATMLH